MTTMQTTAAVDVGAAIITKARHLSLDRTRTFLTLVVLLHRAIIPYLFWSYRSDVILRLRHDRARHR